MARENYTIYGLALWIKVQGPSATVNVTHYVSNYFLNILVSYPSVVSTLLDST